MLFSKKNKEVKFEDMAHDQVPDLKALEATLDFLKNKPAEDSLDFVKNKQTDAAATDKNAVDPATEKSVKTEDSADNDKANTAFPVDSDHKDIAAQQDDNSDSVSATVSAHGNEGGNAEHADEEHLSETDAPGEAANGEHADHEQGAQESVSRDDESSAEDHESIDESIDDSSVVNDSEEVSDAVKEAQAIMAQYEARKASGELKIDERRKYARSRFYHMPANQNQPIIDISELEKGNTSNGNNDQSAAAADEAHAVKAVEGADNAAADTDSRSDLNKDNNAFDNQAALQTGQEGNVTLDDHDKPENDHSEDKHPVSALLTETREPEAEAVKTPDKAPKMDFTNNALLQNSKDTTGKEDKEDYKDGKKAEDKSSKDGDGSADEEKPAGKKGPFTGETKIVKVPPRDIISEVEAKINTLSKLAPLAELKNPLPHPKKHISRKMDFDLIPNKEQMEFDVDDMTGKDFFDVE